MISNPNFRYENDNFLKKLNHLDESLLSVIPRGSKSYLFPGDVVRFSYKYINKRGFLVGELVNVLVVDPGIFNHKTTGNRLMSCYKLDDIPESALKITIGSIKDRLVEASYKNEEKLSKIADKPVSPFDAVKVKNFGTRAVYTYDDYLAKIKPSLLSVFGSTNYRTFDCSKILGNVIKINIRRERL